MQSTPKTASSALLPEQTKNQIRMLLLQQRREQSSQMFAIILITTLSGGKNLIRILRQTLSTGRAIPGTAKTRRANTALIRIQDSLLPQLTAPASAPNLKIRTAFRFLHSFSAEEEQNSLPLFISQRVGTTAFSLAQLWALKQQPLQQAQ